MAVDVWEETCSFHRVLKKRLLGQLPWIQRKVAIFRGLSYSDVRVAAMKIDSLRANHDNSVALFVKRFERVE
ncbi:MAG TPA: hypothetical protein VLZ05_17800 [Mycobacterium sp.]|nr:hypothetical protein [Mycobacterium sp.]HUH70543.1 hypothetical protein [Mycobacterium sp.]